MTRVRSGLSLLGFTLRGSRAPHQARFHPRLSLPPSAGCPGPAPSIPLPPLLVHTHTHTPKQPAAPPAVLSCSRLFSARKSPQLHPFHHPPIARCAAWIAHAASATSAPSSFSSEAHRPVRMRPRQRAFYGSLAPSPKKTRSLARSVSAERSFCVHAPPWRAPPACTPVHCTRCSARVCSSAPPACVLFLASPRTAKAAPPHPCPPLNHTLLSATKHHHAPPSPLQRWRQRSAGSLPGAQAGRHPLGRGRVERLFGRGRVGRGCGRGRSRGRRRRSSAAVGGGG